MDLNLSEGLQIRAFQKYIFNSRKQEDNETIEDFANTLTRLGANIGAEEQTIVDRFIAGLKNDSARLGILQVSTKYVGCFKGKIKSKSRLASRRFSQKIKLTNLICLP